MRGRPLALASLALALLLPARAAGAQGARPRDSWLGVDKIKHFFVSAFVQSVAYSSAQAAGANRGSALALASTATTAMGVARELHDRRTKGVFSLGDLAWDAAGAGVATVMLRKTVR